MNIKIFPLTLLHAAMITPQVKHFLFQVDTPTPFTYLPGQFITIHLQHQETVLKRSYSIANPPRQDNQIEISASYIAGGPGTELLFHLQPQEVVHVSGPFGRLILHDTTPQRYILVATSTGITPYRAMLDDLITRLHHNPDLQIVILQGVQKQEDILFAEELRMISQTHPRITFRAYLSRQSPETLAPDEYSGYVQTAFADLHIDPARDIVYLCGNPRMIDDAFVLLQSYQLTTQHIIREKYISRAPK